MAMPRIRASADLPGWLFAAVGIGCLHLAAAGAPAGYIVVNGATGLAGLAIGYGVSRGRWRIALLVAAGAAMLATAAFGIRIDGVARWIAFGPLRLQPGLILMPALAIAFARRPGGVAGAALAAALVALAWQPDRGTAVAAAGALALLAIVERRARAMAVLAFAAMSVTLLRADPLAPAPFVERVLADAAGDPDRIALLAAGSAAMLAPGLCVLARHRRTDRPAWTFVAIWTGLLAAAAFGAYPAPVLGYGASGVLGYAFSLFAMRRVQS